MLGPLPTGALSFTENFDADAAGWTFSTGHSWAAGQVTLGVSTTNVISYYDLYNDAGAGAGIYTLDISNAAFSVDLRTTNNSAKTFTLQFFAKTLDGLVATSAPITTPALSTTFAPYTYNVNGGTWNQQSGFSFTKVAYVGVMYTNPSTSRVHYLDNFSLTGFQHTPEPGTLLLGLVAMLASWWRRRGLPKKAPTALIVRGL